MVARLNAMLLVAFAVLAQQQQAGALLAATAHCALVTASNTMLTPATSAVAHSACCSPRIPACSAARLLEHAYHACTSTIS